MVNVIIIGAHDFNVTEALARIHDDTTVIVDTSTPRIFSNPYCTFEPYINPAFDYIDEYSLQQFAYIAPNFDFALPYGTPINTPARRVTHKAFHHYDIDYG